MFTTKAALTAALKTLGYVAPTKSTTPVIMNILVDDGRMAASNLETTVILKAPETAGDRFLIPVSELPFIEALPDGMIEIRAVGPTLYIDAGKVHRKTGTIDPGDFVSVPVMGDEVQSFRIKADELIAPITAVSYACGSDKLMQAICVTGIDGRLEMAALDGHQIAVDRAACPEADGISLLLPRAAAALLAKMPFGEDLTVSADNRYLRVTDGELVFMTRLMEGKYFAYRDMFASQALTCTISPASLSLALKRAASTVSASEKAPTILHFSGDRLTVSQQSGTGEYEEELVLTEAIAREIRIGFNNKLIAEAVKHFIVSDDKIRLGLSSPKYPVTITGEKSDLTALVLPVNIR